jgi:putative addiction module component (TIGR02574 family)
MDLAEITRLPLREKFQIMETLWAELGSRVEEMEVPPEHKALLDQRLERIESGESKIHNWDDVKHTIGGK